MGKTAISGASALSRKSGRVERRLSKRLLEGKDNPKKGALWYLAYCVTKAAAMIASAMLFNINRDL